MISSVCRVDALVVEEVEQGGDIEVGTVIVFSCFFLKNGKCDTIEYIFFRILISKILKKAVLIKKSGVKVQVHI